MGCSRNSRQADWAGLGCCRIWFLTSAEMLQADRNRCTAKPHAVSRFPHGHVIPVTRVGEMRKGEQEVLELCLILGFHPLPHPLPDKPPTHFSFGITFTLAHLLGIFPECWMLPFDFLLCRNHSSRESLL